MLLALDIGLNHGEIRMPRTVYRGCTIRFGRADARHWYYAFQLAGPLPSAAEVVRFGPFPSRVATEQDARWRIEVLTADWAAHPTIADAASTTRSIQGRPHARLPGHAASPRRT